MANPNNCPECGGELYTFDDVGNRLVCGTCKDRLENMKDDLHRAQRVAREGAYNEALTDYAWWKDGHQEVGSCGTTLKQAKANNPHANKETDDVETT